MTFRLEMKPETAGPFAYFFPRRDLLPNPARDVGLRDGLAGKPESLGRFKITLLWQ